MKELLSALLEAAKNQGFAINIEGDRIIITKGEEIQEEVISEKNPKEIIPNPTQPTVMGFGIGNGTGINPPPDKP